LIAALRDCLPAHSPQVVALNDVSVELAAMPSANPRRPVELGHAAYIIYTSGSAGRPKGVVIRHEGLSNVATAQRQTLRVGTASRVLQSSSISFDASIFEVMMALASGGSLSIVPPDLPSGAPLADFIENHGVTIATLSPTLLATLPSDSLPALQTITVAGEACPTGLVRQWSPGRRFLNLYGPTEATIWSTFAECRAGDERPPIGKPIRNTSLYVLDGHRRPVPVGVMGEIYLGGIGLAAGYINRPDLTAERFVDVDVAGAGVQRLYRSGDLGRFHPDGNVEFLGRVDQQVKLRAFRIELGEIEAALAAVRGVRDAAVLLRQDPPGDKRIVAYLTRADDQPPLDDQAAAGWEAARVASWKRLYDASYSQPIETADPRFNITGWNSSYTGLPIREAEMREQVDGTIDRLTRLQPSRVLEVGCGSGLLLLRLAHACRRYVGTDFSGASLNYVRNQLSDLPQVELVECHADDLQACGREAFDLVVLNSVVQYFPSERYLDRVLEAALDRVPDAGHIFIGDVRSLPLLGAFHAAVELERSHDGRTTADLETRVHQRVAEESELVIDPRWFARFRQAHPRIRRMTIEPRRGRSGNELTRFRYDVTFEIGRGANEPGAVRSIAWSDVDGLAGVRALLETLDHPIVMCDVPNARVEREALALALLAEDDRPKTVGELRRALNAAAAVGVEPEDLWQLAADGRHDVRVCGAASGRPDCVDVWLQPRGDGSRSVDAGWSGDLQADADGTYANVPYGQSAEDRWTATLRTALQATLPAYMVPSAFVVLDRMPLTPSGKVNRRALPAPDRQRPALAQTLVTPRTPTEQAIGAVWQEVLGVEKVGVDDNFFDLGGHSLLLVQLHGQLASRLGVDVTVMDLFRYPTIGSFARFISLKKLPGPAVKATPATRSAADRPAPWRNAGRG
jgi:amino acid adenylation domain-containing protein